MAPPINAPVAGEIWHLSIEDLFQPVQETPRLGGEGPFVINLSVSTAPIAIPGKAFSSRSDAHVYQIQVTEDGRTRFRLRLGPFATEDEADAILADVRDTYPGALTATASSTDLRVIESMDSKAKKPAAQKPPTPMAVPRKVEQPKAAQPAAAPPMAAQPMAAQPMAAQPAVEAKLPEAKPVQAASPNIIEAAVKAEIAKIDAEISVDIAWPMPELKVPPAAPVRAAAPPPAQLPIVEEFPAAVAKATSPVAQPAASSAAAAAVTAWVLPELDIPLPPVQNRAAPPLPVLTASAAVTPPKPVESTVETPLALVNEAPVLTEVVLPKKSGAKAAPRKAVIAPTLTEAVATRGKAAKKAVAAPLVTAPVAFAQAVAPAAPAAPAAVATPVAPIAAAAPPAIVLELVDDDAKPTAHAAPVVNATPPSKPVIPPLPRKPAFVLTQSLVTPRKPMTAKGRPGPAKTMPNRLTSLQHVVVATAPAPAPREVKKLDEPLPDLESTQTIRALTPKELEDNEVSRWFVIQLAIADQAFDPEAVPNLDIFSEYRLYSVAGLDQGRVVHALRLGFFREEIGAVAVASYLAAYWDKPTIKRISVAERERFADQRVEARKDVGATGKHSVIEITDELVARRRRSGKTHAPH